MRRRILAVVLGMCAIGAGLLLGQYTGGASVTCDSLGVRAWSSAYGDGYGSPEAALLAFRRSTFGESFTTDAELQSAITASRSSGTRVDLRYQDDDHVIAELFLDDRLAARASLIRLAGLWTIGTSERCRV
jgi:hypothetical protein